MIPDDDDYKGKLELIMDWSRGNDWFNTAFIEIMIDKLGKNEDLTPGMKAAINRCYSKTALKEHIWNRKSKLPR